MHEPGDFESHPPAFVFGQTASRALALPDHSVRISWPCDGVATLVELRWRRLTVKKIHYYSTTCSSSSNTKRWVEERTRPHHHGVAAFMRCAFFSCGLWTLELRERGGGQQGAGTRQHGSQGGMGSAQALHKLTLSGGKTIGIHESRETRVARRHPASLQCSYMRQVATRDRLILSLSTRRDTNSLNRVPVNTRTGPRNAKTEQKRCTRHSCA